jgi:hypothetical protein
MSLCRRCKTNEVNNNIWYCEPCREYKTKYCICGSEKNVKCNYCTKCATKRSKDSAIKTGNLPVYVYAYRRKRTNKKLIEDIRKTKIELKSFIEQIKSNGCIGMFDITTVMDFYDKFEEFNVLNGTRDNKKDISLQVMWKSLVKINND